MVNKDQTDQAIGLVSYSDSRLNRRSPESLRRAYGRRTHIASLCVDHLDGPHARIPVGSSKIGLIRAEQKPHLTNLVQTDERVSDKDWARREGMISFAGYPLLVEGKTVGVIAMFA